MRRARRAGRRSARRVVLAPRAIVYALAPSQSLPARARAPGRWPRASLRRWSCCSRARPCSRRSPCSGSRSSRCASGSRSSARSSSTRRGCSAASPRASAACSSSRVVARLRVARVVPALARRPRLARAHCLTGPVHRDAIPVARRASRCSPSRGRTARSSICSPGRAGSSPLLARAAAAPARRALASRLRPPARAPVARRRLGRGPARAAGRGRPPSAA